MTNNHNPKKAIKSKSKAKKPNFIVWCQRKFFSKRLTNHNLLVCGSRALVIIRNFLSTVSSLFIALLGIWWAGSPSVTIEPGTTLNGKDAFETRFYAQNQRPYIIKNWHYYCNIRVPDNPFISSEVGADVYPHLGPFAKSSLHCESQLSDGKSLSRALMAISVVYDLPYLNMQVSNSTIFFLKRDADGNAQWLPFDGGQNLGDMIDLLRSLPIP